MIPKEILKKIRKIEIRTGKLVSEVFAGQYSSVFKGRGMEFNEVREYQPGDDIRSIDWNVTARTGHPYIKKFVEERELTVMFVVDASASNLFGTRGMLKRELAAEVSALLAFSAIRNNDKVGLIIVTDKVEKYLPPKKGTHHVLRLIREMLYFKPENIGTDLGVALEYFGQVVNKRSVAFLVSDFLNTGYEKSLKILNKRHDVIALEIKDEKEESLVPAGIIELEDAETGKIMTINSKDSISNDYSSQALKFFKSNRIDCVSLKCGDPYQDQLIKFFRMRAKRFR